MKSYEEMVVNTGNSKGSKVSSNDVSHSSLVGLVDKVIKNVKSVVTSKFAYDCTAMV